MRIRFSAVSASIVGGAIVTAAFAQSLSGSDWIYVSGTRR